MIEGTLDTQTLEGNSDSFILDHTENVGNLIDVHFQYLTFA